MRLGDGLESERRGNTRSHSAICVNVCSVEARLLRGVGGILESGPEVRYNAPVAALGGFFWRREREVGIVQKV
jgi:hypothetical protein